MIPQKKDKQAQKIVNAIYNSRDNSTQTKEEIINNNNIVFQIRKERFLQRRKTNPIEALKKLKEQYKIANEIRKGRI